MKSLSLTCVLVLAVSAWAQDFEKKVTFQCKATPADQVMAQLATASGIAMGVDPSVAQEVLVVSVKDVSIGELMKRIATATDGQWVKSGGTYLLSPDAGKQADELDKATKARQAQITTTLAELQKRTAAGSALKLLALQDPAILAKVGPGERVVFSSDPTAAQVSANGMTADFIQSLFDQSGNSASPPPEQNSGNGQSNQRQPSQAILAVSNDNDILMAKLVVYDQSGMQLLVREENISLHPAIRHFSVPDSLDKADSSGVQESPETALIEKSGFIGFTAKPSGLDKDTLDLILHPEKHDPLSFFTSDALLQRAQECGDQLVADVPDATILDRSSTAKQFLDMEISRGNLSAIEDKGWLIVSPGNPGLSRVERANRSALGDLLAAVNKKGVASLSDLADFAVTEGHPPLENQGGAADASGPYIRTFVPEWQDFTPSENRFLLLRFYGFLTGDQRQDLISNQQLSIGSLSGDARSTLEEIAYDAYARYRVETGVSVREPQGARVILQNGARSQFRRRSPLPSLSQNSYLSEPTEALGEGISAAGNVKVSINASGPAGNGGGGLNLFTFHFNLAPQVFLDQKLEEPQGGP